MQPKAKFSLASSTGSSPSGTAGNNLSQGSTIVQTIIIPAGASTTFTTVVDQDTATGKPTITSVMKPLPTSSTGGTHMSGTGGEAVPDPVPSVTDLPTVAGDGASSSTNPFGMLPQALISTLGAPFTEPIPVGPQGTAQTESVPADAPASGLDVKSEAAVAASSPIPMKLATTKPSAMTVASIIEEAAATMGAPVAEPIPGAAVPSGPVEAMPAELAYSDVTVTEPIQIAAALSGPVQAMPAELAYSEAPVIEPIPVAAASSGPVQAMRAGLAYNDAPVMEPIPVAAAASGTVLAMPAEAALLPVAESFTVAAP
jgi:hypothetical protein